MLLQCSDPTRFNRYSTEQQLPKYRSITNKDLKVPEKPKLKCMGFTYNEAKFFNMLPPQMRETKDSNTLKTMDMGKHPFILVITI